MLFRLHRRHSRVFTEHLTNLTEVFSRLREASLKLKPRKCSFLQTYVYYLGFMISKHGISPDDRKVEKVKHYPVPRDVTQVRQFLGLASYYRRFIANFAKIASPLYTLTKKGQEFAWTTACQDSFAHLKSLLVTAPVLCYPQFGDKEFMPLGSCMIGRRTTVLQNWKHLVLSGH